MGQGLKISEALLFKCFLNASCSYCHVFPACYHDRLNSFDTESQNKSFLPNLLYSKHFITIENKNLHLLLYKHLLVVVICCCKIINDDSRPDSCEFPLLRIHTFWLFLCCHFHTPSPWWLFPCLRLSVPPSLLAC